MYKQNINENYSAISADSANPLISYLTMILVLYSRHLRQVLFKFLSCLLGETVNHSNKSGWSQNHHWLKEPIVCEIFIETNKQTNKQTNKETVYVSMNIWVQSRGINSNPMYREP